MGRAMGWRARSTSSPHPAPASASWLTPHNLRGQGNGHACPLDGRATALTPGQRRNRMTPQSYTYAPFYPGLQYNHSQQDFYGGNFWDLRATGYKLQSPAAEQAQDPPVDPNEMGFP